MRPHLSAGDIARLLSDPSEEARAEIAGKLGRDVEAGVLSGQEKIVAADIMRVLVRDAAELVRAALALAIARAADVPADVARLIAEDIDSIAVPFIEQSPVLEDEVLIDILRGGSEAKALAIAGREGLGAAVTSEIARVAEHDAVVRLLANATAQIVVSGYRALMARWPQDQDVIAGVVRRPGLPAAIAEDLVSGLSREMLAALGQDGALARAISERLALERRESDSVSLLASIAETENLPFFVHRLHVQGRLTGQLIVRAACMGEMPFVEAALAERAGISRARAWTLVHDAGRLGLKALCERAGLVALLYPALRAAVEAYHDMQLEGPPEDRAPVRRVVCERVLTRCGSMLPEREAEFLIMMARRGDGVAARQAAAG